MNGHEPKSLGSKKILVNPLVAGNNIHFDKGKYTIANSNSGVKVSSSNVARGETVHYNPKFFSQNCAIPKKENVHVNPNYLVTNAGYCSTSYSTSSIHINPYFISATSAHYIGASSNAGHSFGSANPNNGLVPPASKYKFVRNLANDNPADEKPAIVSTHSKPQEPTTVSKYKLVYSTAPSSVQKPPSHPGIVIKSKYSIRTCQPNVVLSTSTSSRMVSLESKKRIRCDFKKISRTKLIRRSVLCRKNKKKWQKRMLKVKKQRLSFSKTRKHSFRLNNTSVISVNQSNSSNNSFQSYSRTKIVRKSVLRAQIESRKFIRKSLNTSLSCPSLLQPLVKSKYKLVLHESSSTAQKNNESTSATRRSLSLVKTKKRKSAIAKLTSKLRKNNQRCLFYNRFGRCKGKDRGTCNKIHDPLYISICKKLPFGECSDKSCLLSHDVKPGKMPTCYHYLAGICKREHCPFLHIKVNPKAPICQSFLQGYCPDVFNCLKRHEYVCPIFAEKGTCPKGKSCAHPHKVPTVHSKLLLDNQRPLMTRNPDQDRSPRPGPSFAANIRLSGPEADGSGPRAESPELKNVKQPAVFTRYFTVPLALEPCDNEESTDDSEII